MRTAAWLAIALVLFAALSAYEARVPLSLLPQSREWSARATDQDVAELAGVRVRVVLANAAALPDQPQQAVLLVRLALSGPEAARAAWVDCRASLIGPDGSRWTAMTGPGFGDAGYRLAPDGQSHLACMPAPFTPPPEGAEILSDQAFMVPVAMLDKLRLRVSGQGTRPEALEFRLSPVLGLGGS